LYIKNAFGGKMDDILQKIENEKDFFKKILGKLPGFSGYFERRERRAADKLLRDSIADKYESLWGRISTLQKDAISNGDIDLIDDLEASALKIRQFVDRIRTASYGYAGFFDAIPVKTDELDKIYQYDYQLLAMEEEVGRAIDNVESSFGTDGLAASIRHLTQLSQNCIDAFEKRKEVILSISGSETK
jgi:hypothetical protein